MRLGERNAREGEPRHLDGNPEQSLDLLAVALCDRRDAGGDELLLHRHDVLVRLDPADLGIDRGELRRVPRRERRVGAEDGRDREHLPEPGGLRHLLVVLRGLSEVGPAQLEVLELEELGAGLRGGRHERRRVDLDVPAVDPPGPPGVLERRLDLEDERVPRLPEVEESPVEALVDRGVVRDRGLGVGGGRHLDLGDEHLDAAELHALVVLEDAGDDEERALGERGDLLRDRVERPLLAARVHELDRAGFVAEHDELHLFWSRTVSTQPATVIGPSWRRRGLR